MEMDPASEFDGLNEKMTAGYIMMLDRHHCGFLKKMIHILHLYITGCSSEFIVLGGKKVYTGEAN